MVIVSLVEPGPPMNQPSHVVFRLATLLFAILLGVQCVWLLLTEFSRPGIYEFPTNAAAAVAARNKRIDASWAAMVGVIRGGLWAESAFTYADLLWGDAGGGANLAQARSSLDHALADAPHQSSAWLLLAGLASRYQLRGIDAKEAVKMSYYTGPSELELMPLRLQIAAHSDAFSDIELRDSISREVRLLFTHQQKFAIVAAYNAAPSAGRQFIEQTIREIDPSAVESLRATTQK
jgi:hypothetical protein